MKLAHRNYLGLNARRPVFGVYEGLQDSNQPAQLHVAKKAEILSVASLSIILSRGRTTKALIRLRGCVGWSAPLIFECNCHYNTM